MTEPVFDAAGLFDDDYLHFYTLRDPDGTGSDADADLIWRLLDLKPGMEVLDLACGYGRIANRLAARGPNVTGLDITPRFLDIARQGASERGINVDYVEGDMRSLPWTGRFDRVVNWFTSFGYFSDDDNRCVLSEIARALKPGGQLAIELNNLAAVLRTYQNAIVVERDGDLMVDRHALDPLTGRNRVVRTIMRDGTLRHIPFEVRMFTFPEIRGWLHEAGFGEVSAYGEDGAPLTAEHRRMIVVAGR